MSEIPILSRKPMVLTKDTKWLEQFKQGRHWERPAEGRIFLLPEDAVLVIVPEVMHSEEVVAVPLKRRKKVK